MRAHTGKALAFASGKVKAEEIQHGSKSIEVLGISRRTSLILLLKLSDKTKWNLHFGWSLDSLPTRIEVWRGKDLRKPAMAKRHRSEERQGEIPPEGPASQQSRKGNCHK